MLLRPAQMGLVQCHYTFLYLILMCLDSEPDCFFYLTWNRCHLSRIQLNHQTVKLNQNYKTISLKLAKTKTISPRNWRWRREQLYTTEMDCFLDFETWYGQRILSRLMHPPLRLIVCGEGIVNIRYPCASRTGIKRWFVVQIELLDMDYIMLNYRL